MAKDKLFLLIHSLSKNEKRYFHHFAHRHISENDTQYLQLFNTIAGNKEYNEPAIRKELGIPESERNFHKTKSYLYDLVLHTLVLMHQESSDHGKVLQMLGAVEVLCERQLFAEALVLLKKVKALANSNELLELSLAAYRWEDNIYITSQTVNDPDISIRLNEEERMKLVSELASFTHMRMIYLKYANLFKDGTLTPALQKQMLELFEHPLIQQKQEPEDIGGRRMYFILNLLDRRLQGDAEGALFYNRKIFELLETYPENFYYNEYLKIYCLFIMIQALVENKIEKEAAFFLQKMRDLVPHSPQNKYFHFHFLYYCELILLKFRKKLKACLPLIKQYEIESRNYNHGIHRIHEYRNIQLIINILISERKPAEALQFINRLLNDLQAESNAAPFYFHARLMKLVAHFELEDYNLLDSLVRQTAYFVETRSVDLSFPNVMLRFFKKILKPGSDPEKTFEELGKELSALLTIPAERLHLQGLLESDWLLQHGVTVKPQKPGHIY